MKILHTSDWHLGHSLYNHDRSEEQTDMLRQIIDIVRTEKPDVFLLCGDIYHTSQPSAATQRLFADTLVDLHTSAPDMRIFVTAGNHDSPSKHDIFSRPWQALNVITIGSIAGMELNDLIFHIPDKGYIIPVPFVNQRNMPEDFYQNLIAKCESGNSDSLPIIMMAHTTVAGVNYAGHDHSSDLSVGGIDCIGAETFSDAVDYLALGHIHKPQTLKKESPAIRYSGSPVAVSFDEDYEHSITIVEVKNHGDTPIIRAIPIKNMHPLVTLPRDEAYEFDGALEYLRDFPDNIPAYLRLNIEISDFLPVHARDKVLDILSSKQARFCTFNIFRKCSDKTASDDKQLTVNEFREMQPIDVVRRFADETGVDLSDEQMDMLSSLFAQNFPD